MIVTLEQLRQWTAYSKTEGELRELIGDSGHLRLTREFCRPHAADFCWDTLAYRLLPEVARRAYEITMTPLRRDAYLAAVKPILARYDMVTQPALEIYYREASSIRIAYDTKAMEAFFDAIEQTPK